MKYLTTTTRYLKWHYSLGYYYVSVIYKNVFVFLFEYFAIRSLLKEYFLPWKRMAGSYKEAKSVSVFFETLLQNLIMRVVGIILRSAVLFIGGLIILLYLPLYPVLMIIWSLFPIIILTFIITGIILILSIFIK